MEMACIKLTGLLSQDKDLLVIHMESYGTINSPNLMKKKKLDDSTSPDLTSKLAIKLQQSKEYGLTETYIRGNEIE